LLAAHLDLGGLQRPAAKQLTHAGLDASELAEDDLPRLGLGRRPVSKRLQVLEDRVEALREVPDDMVVIERLPMMGVKRRRGSPDQHCARDRFLQLYGLLEDVFQRRLHAMMLSDPRTTLKGSSGPKNRSPPGRCHVPRGERDQRLSVLRKGRKIALGLSVPAHS
jgi:hypothetical protein